MHHIEKNETNIKMKRFYTLLTGFLMSINVFGQNIPTDQNPKYTYSINPKYTYSINPKYTYSINPKYTYNLNPKYTYSINPKYTHSLNPKYTLSINPEYTSGLNPFKGSWTGKYLFNDNGELTGIMAKANNNIYLLYDTDGEWIGYFVRAETNFNLFSLDGEWTGQYLCSDSENGYNLFNESGEWTTNYVK
jgi:hypothetical protein